jgi:hypothetical protein
MSVTERAMSATALTKGSSAEDEGAAGAEVTGSANLVADGGMVVVGGLDIADTRLIGLGVLPELLRRL